MSQKVLVESGGALRVSEGGKWSATLLTAGVGSSGTYSEEMLAEHGPGAFRAGLKLWFGHPKDGEGPGDRDARDQWGVLDEDASFEPGEGLVGKIRVLPHWKEVVDSLGDQASLSIYAIGESDKDGNVTALLEDATNSVDIVSYPGRPGSGLKKKLEAARASHQPGTTSAPGDKESNMEIKDLVAAVEALTKSLEPVVAFVAEQKVALESAVTAAEAKATDVEKEKESAIASYSAAVKVVSEAKLLPTQEADILADAALGKDIAPLIEKATKVRDEALTVTGGSTGYVHESAAGNKDDFSLNLGGKF